MASRIKISKPERLPREGITDTDLNTWKNELLNYLGQDDDFDNFTESGSYPAWEAAENNRNRIEAHAAPDAATDLKKRRKQLSRSAGEQWFLLVNWKRMLLLQIQIQQVKILNWERCKRKK